MDDYLSIFTDGSSAPSPRTGGVGFRIIFPNGEIKDISPYGYRSATNNMMELLAPILALKEVLKLYDLKDSKGIVIYTDSQYVVNNYKNAMWNWPKSKWLKVNGEPVANTEQWKELIRLFKRISQKFHLHVDFEKVKAHVGIEHNEAVDKLAKKSRKGILRNGIKVINVRKKHSDKSTVRGSIVGEGQKISIRIIDSGWDGFHKLYKFRSEILSKESKYFGNLDFIYSKENMSAGHSYYVILMKDLEYCCIKKIIREIKKKQK